MTRGLALCGAALRTAAASGGTATDRILFCAIAVQVEPHRLGRASRAQNRFILQP